jgi:hypothetical protein
MERRSAVAIFACQAQHRIMTGRNIVPYRATPIVTDDATGTQLAVPESGRMRKFSLRFGAIEVGYASAHVRRLAFDSAGAHRRSGIGLHLAYIGTALAVVAGAFSVVAIQSGAFERHDRTLWPIVDNRPPAQGSIRAEIAQQPVSTLVTVAPAPVPPTLVLRPDIVRAAIRESLSGYVADQRSARSGAAGLDAPSGAAPAPVVEPRLTGPLDKVPAVASAIARAVATGEVQDWAYGAYSGAVVVGERYEAGGTVCRDGSILARDPDQTSRTEPFQRCVPSRRAASDASQ